MNALFAKIRQSLTRWTMISKFQNYFISIHFYRAFSLTKVMTINTREILLRNFVKGFHEHNRN